MSIVLFDGYCNLCSWAVKCIVRLDKKQEYNLIAIQEADSILVENLPVSDLNQPSTIFLIRDQKIFQKSGAVLRILGSFSFPWVLLNILLLVPPFIRDWVYMGISRNRYKWFGKSENCYMPGKSLQ